MATPHREGTPEKYLACPMGVDADAIYSAIFRAQAVLNLLHSKFFKDGEAPEHDQVVIYALDSIAGYLNQINILMSEA